LQRRQRHVLDVPASINISRLFASSFGTFGVFFCLVSYRRFYMCCERSMSLRVVSARTVPAPS
jgi:hypothetical protein